MVDAGQLLSSKSIHALYNINRSESVYSALKLMRERHAGSLLVTDNDMALGIFTERDYLTKIVVKGRASQNTQVGDVMSNKIVCVDTQASLDQCLAVLANERFRHLPVVNEGVSMAADGVPLKDVRGVLSVRDVIRQIKIILSATGYSSYASDVHAISERAIGDFVSQGYATVTPDDTVRYAVDAMLEAHAGRAVVLDEQKQYMVGILTERDYLYKVILENRDSSHTKVLDIMTPKDRMFVASPSSSVNWCIAQMVDQNCRQLPVVDDPASPTWTCKGIISVGDIISLHQTA